MQHAVLVGVAVAAPGVSVGVQVAVGVAVNVGVTVGVFVTVGVALGPGVGVALSPSSSKDGAEVAAAALYSIRTSAQSLPPLRVAEPVPTALTAVSLIVHTVVSVPGPPQGPISSVNVTDLPAPGATET